MSTTTAGVDPLDALGNTLRRQLDAARARARELQQRRHDLERELQAIRAAESSAQENVAALEAVAAEAAALLGQAIGEPSVIESRGADEENAVAKLRGAELRQMAVRVALRRGAYGEPVHWREWYGWMREAGFDAAGKKAEATFLTQLARSPLVRRTAHDGVYFLDLGSLREAHEQLTELHEQLSTLPSPGQTSLLEGFDDVRERRRALQSDIANVERNLTEMIQILGNEPPPGWHPAGDADPHRVIEAWLNAGPGLPQQPPLLD